jgi:hypothetical protein
VISNGSEVRCSALPSQDKWYYGVSTLRTPLSRTFHLSSAGRIILVVVVVVVGLDPQCGPISTRAIANDAGICRPVDLHSKMLVASHARYEAAKGGVRNGRLVQRSVVQLGKVVQKRLVLD